MIVIPHSAKLANKRNYQLKINQQVIKHLKEKQFKISKIFYINDIATYNCDNTYKKFFAIDNDKKQIALVNYENAKLLIINFSDIINYEVYENGNQRMVGGNIGGIRPTLFGNLRTSGLFSSETNSYCKDLRLIIRINRYDTPHVSYDIISKTFMNIGENKSNERYSACINSLQEAISFFEIIQNEHMQVSNLNHLNNN